MITHGVDIIVGRRVVGAVPQGYWARYDAWARVPIDPPWRERSRRVCLPNLFTLSLETASHSAAPAHPSSSTTSKCITLLRIAGTRAQRREKTPPHARSLTRPHRCSLGVAYAATSRSLLVRDGSGDPCAVRIERIGRTQLLRQRENVTVSVSPSWCD